MVKTPSSLVRPAILLVRATKSKKKFHFLIEDKLLLSSPPISTDLYHYIKASFPSLVLPPKEIFAFQYNNIFKEFNYNAPDKLHETKTQYLHTLLTPYFSKYQLNEFLDTVMLKDRKNHRKPQTFYQRFGEYMAKRGHAKDFSPTSIKLLTKYNNSISSSPIQIHTMITDLVATLGFPSLMAFIHTIKKFNESSKLKEFDDDSRSASRALLEYCDITSSSHTYRITHGEERRNLLRLRKFIDINSSTKSKSLTPIRDHLYVVYTSPEFATCIHSLVNPALQSVAPDNLQLPEDLRISSIFVKRCRPSNRLIVNIKDPLERTNILNVPELANETIVPGKLMNRLNSLDNIRLNDLGDLEKLLHVLNKH